MQGRGIRVALPVVSRHIAARKHAMLETCHVGLGLALHGVSLKSWLVWDGVEIFIQVGFERIYCAVVYVSDVARETVEDSWASDTNAVFPYGLYGVWGGRFHFGNDTVSTPSF